MNEDQIRKGLANLSGEMANARRERYINDPNRLKTSSCQWDKFKEKHGYVEPPMEDETDE